MLFGLCAGATLAFGGAGASTFKFNEYKQAPPLHLHVPVTPDSITPENPFKPESMLNARRWKEAMSLGWTTVTTDSDGNVRLVTPKRESELHTYSTRVRASKFAKGKLNIKSTSRASVKIDGKPLITKETADSSDVCRSGDLTLLPERTYDVTVDLISLPTDPSHPLFSLEFEPAEGFDDVETNAGPALERRVTPFTTMTGERTSGVSLSPDGKYMIVYTRQVYSADETVRRAVLSETATGRVLNDNLSADAFWLPGGCAYAVPVKRNGAYDFSRTEVPSLKTTTIARDVPEKSVTFLPGGRYLLYYNTVAAPAAESGPMHRYGTPDSRIPGNDDRSYLVRYDLQNHVSEPLTYGGSTTSVLSSTSDGSRILLSSTRNEPDNFPFYFTTLVQMDMKTLRCDTLVRDLNSTLYGAVYSPDGKRAFVVSGPSAFNGIGAKFDPHPIGNDYDAQGYILDLANGDVKAMTKDFDPSVGYSVIWNTSDGKIYFIGEEGFNHNLYCLDPLSGKINKLKTGIPTVRSFSMGENDSKWLAYCGGSFTSDGQAWVLDLKNGKSRLVADPLQPELADIEFGEMQPWNFRSSDGTLIDGWMCLPPGFDPEKKYPLIVYYYGGTSPSSASFYHLYSPQVFASRDYVVYVLNPSGTTGYGQEFSARHVNAWGKRTADEIIQGTKEFCKAHPFVDEKKIGCIGASYGGFMTQYLQTQTDIFAAAVSHAGISNVTSYWGEGFWGYSYNSVAAAKSYPWNNPDLFTKQGSLFNADKIHTPLLLLHGTQDTNVPIGESIQLFNALKVLGRDVEFITVENENHVISGFDRKPVWQNTIMAFFAKYLQDDPRWWNELYK